MANDHDPNSTPHPNEAVYETCGVCRYEYKLRDQVCTNCDTAEPPEGSDPDAEVDTGASDDGAPVEPG